MDDVKIYFNGKGYPARKIQVDDTERLVSVESLSDKLIGDDGCPVSERAKELDDILFFYVPDYMIGTDDATLVRYVSWQTPGYGVKAVS